VPGKPLRVFARANLVEWEYHGLPCQQIAGQVEVVRAKLSRIGARPGADADGWHSP
jgi:hypothetical protein